MTTNLPVSLLEVQDLVSRFPDRRREIVVHARSVRERELVMLRESRHLISWHPLHTAKTIIVAGIIAFAFSFLLSQVALIGRIYSDTKRAGLSIPLPLIGSQNISLQNVVPTSTALETISRVPAYGVRESIYIAIGVMVSVLLERIVTSVFHWKKIKLLREAEKQLLQEIHLLKEWEARL